MSNTVYIIDKEIMEPILKEMNSDRNYNVTLAVDNRGTLRFVDETELVEAIESNSVFKILEVPDTDLEELEDLFNSEGINEIQINGTFTEMHIDGYDFPIADLRDVSPETAIQSNIKSETTNYSPYTPAETTPITEEVETSDEDNSKITIDINDLSNVLTDVSDTNLPGVDLSDLVILSPAAEQQPADANEHIFANELPTAKSVMSEDPEFNAAMDQLISRKEDMQKQIAEIDREIQLARSDFPKRRLTNILKSIHIDTSEANLGDPYATLENIKQKISEYL
jgi:hypothetical protein